MEGAIGFALSAVLRNEITQKQGVIEQKNFDDYEPTRMREMPRVEVHLVERKSDSTVDGSWRLLRGLPSYSIKEQGR